MGYGDNPLNGLKALSAEFKEKPIFNDFQLENRIQIKIETDDKEGYYSSEINLDLKLAIKFCKVLQHEISKLKEAEVGNG